mgnify:CR=1 FL=1
MPEKVTKEEKIVEIAIDKAKEVIKEMRNSQQYIIDKDGELELNEKEMTDKEDLVKVKRPPKNPKEEKLNNPMGGDLIE